MTNGLKWLPHRQSDDIANVQQTELIYARLLQSVVKLPSVALWYQANSVLEPPSVTPVGWQCDWPAVPRLLGGIAEQAKLVVHVHQCFLRPLFQGPILFSGCRPLDIPKSHLESGE